MSGTYSPSLGFSIAFARLDKGHDGEGKVKIRNNEFKVEIVSPPFMRKGKMLKWMKFLAILSLKHHMNG